MIKNWFLFGLILLLLTWLLVGCGVTQGQYDAMVAERDSALAMLEPVQGELDATNLELERVQLDLQLLRDQLSEAQVVPAPASAPAPPPVSQPEPPPIARIGHTIPICIAEQELSMTLLWWQESNIALDRFGYETYTAVPGRKFIILAYEFRNDGNREQITPSLGDGEIVTAPKGYCYKDWNPFLLGISSWDYNPRKASPEEINTLIGDDAAYERLLPEESVKGCMVFEIPQDATPVEATIIGIPYLIKF